MVTAPESAMAGVSNSSLILPGGMEFTRAQFDMALRTDFASFIQQCVHTLLPNVKFLPNWHIDAIVHHLDLVRRPGYISRLLINLPPRSLKSIIVSVAFPAFVLGHDPTARLIVASYGSELSIKLGNDCRAIMNADWYRRIFPGTRISKIKNTEFEFATTKGGFRLATSVGGTLTGRGGDIIIVDEAVIHNVRESIALVWKNVSRNALRKRTWAPTNLFGKGSLQVPAGEFGIIYVSYHEGARAEVADLRVQAFSERIQEFEHSAKIRIPIAVLSRLYPRALSEGQPDLIESGVRYVSGAYGEPKLFDLFPTTLFTSPG